MTGALVRSRLAALAALGLLASAARAESPADLVLRNGVVHTLDARRPKAQALAITGQRIVAVGSDAEVGPFAGPKTRVIDLAGATVIPGFKDSHGHLLSMGYARMAVDVTAEWRSSTGLPRTRKQA